MSGRTPTPLNIETPPFVVWFHTLVLFIFYVIFGATNLTRFAKALNMHTEIILEPELGTPVPDPIDYDDLRIKAQAACETAAYLEKHGLDLKPNSEEEEIAETLLTAYASDPIKTSKAVTPNRLATLTPATVTHVNTLLNEFSHAVVKHAAQIRHLVTNKLIIESENSDARVRIRALELLGKISDVGLFSEKQEITISHQSTDELRQRLREKLSTIMPKTGDIQDVEEIAGEIREIEEEVEKELGLEEDEDVSKTGENG